jgi:hypothetical protein
VVADEVADCSNKEQLGIVLRYVNPFDNFIREDLVTFVECDTGVTGKAIADNLLNFITSSGLDPNMLCGQSYDGAGNMAGKTNGAAAIIPSINPLALYPPLHFTLFNLAVFASLTIQSVRNMIGVVNKVSTFFFAHPKRRKSSKRQLTRYSQNEMFLN